MRRMYSKPQIEAIASEVANGIVKDKMPHLYALQLYYSDTAFTVYTKSHGDFELNTEYELVNSNEEYILSDALSTDLVNILNEIKVGNYGGYPFTAVSDELTVFVNKSYNGTLYIMDSDGIEIIEVDLDAKSVIHLNNEDWNIKFTQLF